MAQALFDEHPLEEYLKEAGDYPATLPGSLEQFCDELEDVYSLDDQRWLPTAVGNLQNMFYAGQILFWTVFPTAHREFAERFKYDVISSTLLSTSTASSPLSAHAHRRPNSPDLAVPGKLSSTETDVTHVHEDREYCLVSFTLLSIGIASLWLRYRVAAAILLIGSLFYSQTRNTTVKHGYVVHTLESLESLKTASSIWESVVSEAIKILESDEQSAFYGSSSPSSPSSPLRIALRSSLLTTHTQCDNIRPLVAALTSTLELSQLSEMYAPPSPIQSASSISSRVPALLSPHARSLSLQERHQTSLALRRDNRSTWNGSYTSLAGVDSPAPRVPGLRGRRRPSLLSLLETQVTASASVPTSPMSAQLLDVREEEQDGTAVGEEGAEAAFGPAALSLRRKRRSRGMHAFGLTSPRSAPSLRLSTSSPSSRFTTFQAVRHPLSLSALQRALHGALSAKRYACAHLLALRFDDDDEAYWEDVRSVMALLTTTFEDASERLEDALNETERRGNVDELSSPTFELPQVDSSRDDKLSPLSQSSSFPSIVSTKQVPSSQLASFAPIPNNLARFAAHVEAISTALTDAQEHLKQCVASLKADPISTSPASSSSVPGYSGLGAEASPAVHAYEHLRRELGLALRECERGKGVLVDIVETSRLPDAEQEAEEDVPALAHDTGTASPGEPSDKQHTSPRTPPHIDTIDLSPPISVSFSLDQRDAAPPELTDDASPHLLLTSMSRHLPAPGIEQIFESDSAGGVSFSRERSKLTREERLRRIRARRESGKGEGLGLDGMPGSEDTSLEVVRDGTRHGWGPGGDVVQELKDVIWKVGERKRSMIGRNMPSKPSPDRDVSFQPDPEPSAALRNADKTLDHDSLSLT